MKISIVSLAVASLACLSSTGASAYDFSPPDASVRLHGKLTFTPNEGNPQPFECGVTLELKTKNDEITGVVFTKMDCNALVFVNLPWIVNITNANSGNFGEVGFGSSKGNCITLNIQFQGNTPGIWTLPPGQCISGTLTSRPTLTIVP